MTTRNLTLCLLLIGSLCLGTARAGLSATSCFFSKCHDNSAFRKSIVHKPVAQEMCSECHSPHVARFKGLLQKKENSLCFSCHKGEADTFSKGLVHEPVRQGKCTACHDPHASEANALIKGRLNDICFSCHSTVASQYRVAHSPFKKGQCTSCHTPHNGETYQLLKVSGKADEICFSCHKQQEVDDGHKNFPVKPKSCLSCHSPHGSNEESLIRKVQHRPYKKGKTGCGQCHKDGGPVGTDTCLGCHKESEKGFLTTHSHLMNRAGNSCTQCHTPHASDSTILIKGRQDQLCKSCHEDTFLRHKDTLYAHPNVLMCNSCHDAHGSNQVAMLKGGGIDLCSGCHKNEGRNTHPVGEGVTDPRSGQTLTCVTCHDPKGTNFKNQLKLSGTEDLCKQCHRY